MKRPLLVIADDLSGAADCAAGFARHVATQVLLDQHAEHRAQPVTALDLDTRRLPAGQAARLNSAVLSAATFAGHALYKKVDSTLRGNLVSEVAALLGRGMALVAPAFPAMGRITLGSVQYVDGIAVNQSDLWRNEGLSGTADLLELFDAQGLRCAALGLDQVRGAELAELLVQHLQAGTQVLVCDAQLDADLRALALASVEQADQLFWVGSAGLAQQLPAALGLTTRVAPALPAAALPVLTVVGSMSRHSQAQAALLAERSGQHWQRIEPQLLLAADAGDRRDALSTRLAAQMASGADLLVSLEQHDRDPVQAALLGAPLARLLLPAIARAGALIATGGETARALLSAAAIDSLQLHGELAPGVVLSSARRQGRELAIVTKAGGFGQPDTLYQAWARLHGASHSQPLSEKEAHHV
ncbi:4-hydroxythreonine-4-phosphate dehydrogenase [Pseudomonas flavescens]|uniref:4-hydroxythreonine-4-phosphate dehydrogenase n=1 Tax=Phytopseudomonas flavescens TaxID=29435 RepID=A0A1G8M067_9GAMM|nr:four-carbon acid sugar kinase family protein [Pseudomonas flavescens]SDI61354.1 4-hydroxythreonine-4-phosphate dehydrogenase [Pseudomonas flavescens]